MTETRDRHLTPRHRSQRDPKPTNGWLDTHREKQLRDGLRELPNLGALAFTTLHRERLGGSGSRSVPGSKPPLNLAAAALTSLRDLPMPDDWPVRDGGLVWVDSRGRVHADDELPGSMLSVLAAWARLAEAELLEAREASTDWRHAEPTPLADQPTVASECAWLARHLLWIAEQQWVTELAEDVRRLVRDCRGLLHERPEYRPSCDLCGGSMESCADGAYYQCCECRRVVEHWAEMKRIAELQAPMTIPELAAALDVPAKTIHDWHRRGLITPVCDAKRGRRFDVYQARQVKATLRRA